MNNFLYLLSGWFGVFTRGSVLIQLVVLAAVMLLYRSSLLRLRLPRSSWKRLALLAAPIVLFQLFAVVLSSYGQPEGLVVLAVNLLLIWAGLTALRLLLRRIQPVQEVEGYWHRAVVPFFLVLALVAFVDSIEGFQMVSAIPLLQMFGQTFTMGSLVMLVLFPYFLVVLSELPVFLAGEALARLAGMEPGNRKAFELLLRYGLIGIGLLWLANQIGLNSTAVAAIAGGLSVGLGFGVKEVFSNFISGIWLLFERSVRPGDILVYEGDPCEVRSLGLRAATLWRDSDNAELLVPNQNFFTATTITYSGSDSLRRSNVIFSAHYRHEPELVVQLILQSVARVPRALKTPPPIARICSYAESSIDYMVLYWIDAPMDNGSIAGEVRRAVWHTFHEQGIEFPYPQRVVHPAQSMPGDQQG
jgi:small-conductance mechanosensitive channel